MWLRLWLTWKVQNASKSRRVPKTQQQVTWSWLQVQIAMPELISEKLQHKLLTARRLVNVPKPKKTSIFSNPNNSSICPSQEFWNLTSRKSSTDGFKSMTMGYAAKPSRSHRPDALYNTTRLSSSLSSASIQSDEQRSASQMSLQKSHRKSNGLPKRVQYENFT